MNHSEGKVQRVSYWQTTSASICKQNQKITPKPTYDQGTQTTKLQLNNVVIVSLELFVFILTRTLLYVKLNWKLFNFTLKWQHLKEQNF